MYVGWGLPPRWGCGIDLSLPASPDGLAARPGAAGYAQLTSRQRLGFLHWLEKGRDGVLGDEAHLRVFLANAEEFLLAVPKAASAVESPERDVLLQELHRLANRYSATQATLALQCALLADFARLQGFEIRGRRAYEDLTFVQTAARSQSVFLRFALAQLAEDGKPMPARWAFQWARSLLSRSDLQDVALCDDLLRRLFVQKYVQSHGEGLRLELNSLNQGRSLSYSPVSAGLAGRPCVLKTENSTLGGSLATSEALASLLVRCFDDLRPYLTRRRLGATPEQCWQLLPVSLWPEEQRLAFRGLVQQAHDAPVTVFFDLVSGYLGVDAAFGKKSLAQVDNRLAEFGLKSLPSLTGDLRPVDATAPFVLMARVDSPADDETAFVELLRIVVSIRSVLDDATRASVDQALTAHAVASPTSRAVRAHREAWLALAHADGLKRLTARAFKKRAQPHRDAVRQLAGVLLASCAQRLDNGLAKYLGEGWASGGKALRLDAQKLSSLLEETGRVQGLLGVLFDPDVAGSAAPPQPATEPAAPSSAGRSKRLLLERLGARTLWPHAQFDALARELSMLPGGALEWANDLAFDTLDTALLDETSEGWVVEPQVLAALLERSPAG